MISWLMPIYLRVTLRDEDLLKKKERHEDIKVISEDQAKEFLNNHDGADILLELFPNEYEEA